MTIDEPRDTSLDQAPAPMPPPVTTASPGSLIREARQAAGLSLDDLATLIKLARPTMEALERDDFNALLEPVYVRGYYRKCAKVLHLDEKALIDGYAQRVAHKAPLPPTKLRLASGSDLGTGSRLPVPTAVLVAVLAVIACALLWFLRGAATSPSRATANATTSLPASVVTEVQSAPTVPPPAETQTPDAAPAASPPASGETAAAEAPAAAPQVASAAVPAAEAPAPVAPPQPDAAAVTGEGPALFKFKGSSWLRIKDADGKLLVRAEFPAGTQRRYGGKLPLDVFIGAAADVALEYDGQMIDLAPYTRENKTAWLQLPAQSAR